MGRLLGANEGLTDGVNEGLTVGIALGMSEGLLVGDMEGDFDGLSQMNMTKYIQNDRFRYQINSQSRSFCVLDHSAKKTAMHTVYRAQSPQ